MTLRTVQSFGEAGPALYICSTPIGNLQDTSQRLIETLRMVDVVAAEDTRQTRKLLTHFDIHPRVLVSYHQHNAATRQRDLLQWWDEGKTVAIVSDAGTPGVSDPGDDAVKVAIAHGVPVVPVPGASAVLSALVCSGFPTQPFTFVGFLPRQKRAAMEELQPYLQLPGSIVFYEAPHRLVQTLKVLMECYPERPFTVAKELTKKHETFFYADDNVEALIEHFEAVSPRGEFVIVVGPRSKPAEPSKSALESVLEAAVAKVKAAIEQGESHTAAVRKVSVETGVRRKELYQATLDETTL